MCCNNSRSNQHSVDLHLHQQHATGQDVPMHAGWPTLSINTKHLPAQDTKMSKPAGVHASRARPHLELKTAHSRGSTGSLAYDRLDVCTIHAADKGPTHSTPHLTLLRPTPNKTGRSNTWVINAACTHCTACNDDSDSDTYTTPATTTMCLRPSSSGKAGKGGGLHTKLACTVHDASVEQGSGLGPERATRYARGACS